MASPDSAASQWVQMEIDEWLKRDSSAERFYIVLTAGEIAWDKSAGDFDWGKTSALHSDLSRKFQNQPLYLDFRWARESTQLSLRNPQFLRAVGKLAAALQNKELDEVVGEDVYQHRLFKTAVSIVVVLLLALTAATSVAAYIAKKQTNEALAAAARERLAAENETKAREAETRQKEQADIAREQAEERRQEADQQREIAEQRRREEERQREIAVRQTGIAEEQKGEAIRQREEAKQQASNATTYAASTTRDPLKAASMLASLHHAPEPTDGIHIAYNVISRRIPKAVFHDHSDWVDSVTFDPGGRYVISGGEDDLVRITPLDKKGAPVSLPHVREVQRVLVTEDGRRLITQTRDGALHFREWGQWEVPQTVKVFEPSVGGFYRLALSPSNKRLLAVSEFGVGVVLDLTGATPKEVYREGSKESPLVDLGWGMGEESVVAVHRNGQIYSVPLDGPRAPTLLGETAGPVLSTSFSDDLNSVATASRNRVSLLSLKDKDLKSWAFETSRLSELCLNKDGTLLLINSPEDHLVRLWSVAEGKVLHTFDGYDPLPSPAPNFKLRGSAFENWIERAHGRTKMMFTPRGDSVVTMPGDLTARLWDIDSGKVTAVLQSNDGPVADIAFSADQKLIATASIDGEVRVWEAEQREPRGITPMPGVGINAVSFSPDGETLLASSWYGTAWVLTKDGRPIQSTLGRVNSAKPEGMRIASAVTSTGSYMVARYGDEAWVYKSSSNSGQALPVSGDDVYCAAFSPDGNLLALGLRTGGVGLYHVNAGGPVKVIDKHDLPIRHIAFNPSGTLVLSIGIDDRPSGDGAAVYLDDVESGAMSGKSLGKVGSVAALGFTVGGARVVTFSGKEVRLWEVGNDIKPVLLGEQESISGVRIASFSRDGRYVATATENEIVLWNADGSGRKLVFSDHRSRVTSIRFNLTGTKLLSASWDGTAHIYSTNGERQPTVLEFPNTSLQDAAFSPDEKMVATAASDGTVRLWHLRWKAILNYLLSFQSRTPSEALFATSRSQSP